MTEFNATFESTKPMSVSFQTTTKTISTQFDTVIYRVPSNYGLITYNGHVLTVS